MNTLSGKHFIFLIIPLILITILSPPLMSAIASGAALETGRRIKVVDAQSGSDSLTFGSGSDPMPSGGYNFTVKVLLEGQTDLLKTFQVALSYNQYLVKCTAVWINKNDPSFVFLGKSIMVPPAGSDAIRNDKGYVFFGAAILTLFASVNVSSGLLCQMNFTVIKTGTFTINVLPSNSWGYSNPADTFLLDVDDHEYGVPPPIGTPWPQYFDPGSLTVSVSAFRSPPIASFTFDPTNPKVRQNVTFDCSGSRDPTGEIVNYTWDFGDGANETTTQNFTIHSFASAGSYVVNLTVFNNFDLNNSCSESVRVGSIPSVNFTFSPVSPARFESVTFNASGSFKVGGNITQYVWDFGDNRTDNRTDPVVTVPGYVYPGVYTVNLTIYDNDGLYNSTTDEIFVGRRPIVSFEYSPLDPMPDQNITFTASVQLNEAGDDISLIRVIWDFSDFSGLSDVNASDTNVTDPLTIQHAYVGQGGVYTVNLTVIDMFGLYTTFIQDVNVTVVEQQAQGADYTLYYVAAVAIIAVIVVAGIFLKRRQKPELARKERYRVI
jgi:PKD repeat protein